MIEQQLHTRLHDLADDLAPRDDPFELVAGARALHRRRRRTYIGVAGTALAVALVAVGVPTAVGTFSAPERPDVAAPTSSLPSEGPSGAAEKLRPMVESVQKHLEFFEVDGSVADVSDDLPCPDAMSRISMATGLTIHGQLGDTVPRVRSGCLWSTSPDPRNPSGSSTDRLDALLRAEPRTTAEDVVASLTADVEDRDCRWTGELDSGSFAGLQECAGSTQDTWTLTVVDADGTGAWVLSMAVGHEMPERFGVVSGTLAGLLAAVHDGKPVEDVDAGPAEEVPISRLNQSFNDVVNGFDARSRPVRLSAPSTPMSCPELPAGLAGRANGELSEVRGPGGSLTCTWSGDTGPSAGPSYSVGFVAGEARVFDSERDVDLDFADGGGDIGACFGVVLPGTDPAGGLAACQLTDREEWRLDLADAGGEGTWVVTLDLPGNAGIDSAETVRALIDLADARW